MEQIQSGRQRDRNFTRGKVERRRATHHLREVTTPSHNRFAVDRKNSSKRRVISEFSGSDHQEGVRVFAPSLMLRPTARTAKGTLHQGPISASAHQSLISSRFVDPTAGQSCELVLGTMSCGLAMSAEECPLREDQRKPARVGAFRNLSLCEIQREAAGCCIGSPVEQMGHDLGTRRLTPQMPAVSASARTGLPLPRKSFNGAAMTIEPSAAAGRGLRGIAGRSGPRRA